MKRALWALVMAAIGAIILSVGWKPGLQTSINYALIKFCLLISILLIASIVVPDVKRKIRARFNR